MKQYTLDATIDRNENINLVAHRFTGIEEEHTHEFIEIVYILSGSGRHSVNGKCYDVRRGDLLFINFGQVHSFAASASMEYINCLINPEFIDRELIASENAMEILALSSFEDFSIHADKLIPMIRFSGRGMLEVEELFRCMTKEFTGKPVNYKTALRGYLLVLLTQIFRAMQTADSAEIISQMSKRTPDILQFIEENYNRKLSLSELSQKCFYNPSYFSRVFKDTYGKNFTEFIAEKRIGEANRLLLETGLSVEEIAARVGYHDRKQFYEVYKKIMGAPPGALRVEQHGTEQSSK